MHVIELKGLTTAQPKLKHLNYVSTEARQLHKSEVDTISPYNQVQIDKLPKKKPELLQVQ